MLQFSHRINNMNSRLDSKKGIAEWSLSIWKGILRAFLKHWKLSP